MGKFKILFPQILCKAFNHVKVDFHADFQRLLLSKFCLEALFKLFEVLFSCQSELVNVILIELNPVLEVAQSVIGGFELLTTVLKLLPFSFKYTNLFVKAIDFPS